jgi:hypothetical protein
LFFGLENGGEMFLRNVGYLKKVVLFITTAVGKLKCYKMKRFNANAEVHTVDTVHS